jgi:hypothetical protein
MSQKVIMKGGYRRRFPVWGRARLINRNPRLINKGHVEDENSKLTSLPMVLVKLNKPCSVRSCAEYISGSDDEGDDDETGVNVFIVAVGVLLI